MRLLTKIVKGVKLFKNWILKASLAYSLYFVNS